MTGKVLIFVTISICAACVSISPQSLLLASKDQRPDVERVSTSHISLRTDPEKVVIHYIDLARDENFDELKKLVSISKEKSSRMPSSRNDANADAPDSGSLAELELTNLYEGIPKMIFAGKMFVDKIRTLEKDGATARVSVILKAETDPNIEIEEIFRLNKIAGEWKISAVRAVKSTGRTR